MGGEGVSSLIYLNLYRHFSFYKLIAGGKLYISFPPHNKVNSVIILLFLIKILGTGNSNVRQSGHTINLKMFYRSVYKLGIKQVAIDYL